MSEDNAKELADREAKAFAKKQNLDSLNQELALNFYPERADFTLDRCLGEEFAADLFDSEPLRCRRDLADARSSMLRPDGQDWVRAATRDDELNERPDMARALDQLNAKFRAFLADPDTGFGKAEKEADNDVVTFGYSVKTAESEIDRKGKRVPVVRCWHLRDCAFYFDNRGIKPDVMFRKFKMSARHIVRHFPNAELHRDIKIAEEKEPDKEFELCHTMMPADEYDWYQRPRRYKGREWASIYYDSQHKKLLREEASERFRYIVDRWMTLPGSQYGYSPAAMTGLADARAMQMMMQILIEAGEKSLDPPMKATEGAVKGDIDLGASGITWVDKSYDERLGPAIEPLLPNNRNIPVGIDLITRSIMAMRDNWYLSKLRLPMQAKTAFETQALLEQFIRENIPLFSPWQAGLSMMLDEVFPVMQECNRDWWFAHMQMWPDELIGSMGEKETGAEIVWSFENPLRDAIKRNMVNQATQVLGFAAALEKIKPGISQAIWTFDKVGRDATRGTGGPADWLNDEQDSQNAMAANQQGADILGALGMAEQAANVVKTGSEAAANLNSINGEAADSSFAYGPA